MSLSDPYSSSLSRWAVTVTLALGIMSLSVGTAAASEFALRVEGLACPFCAHGLEQKLTALPGVATVRVLLDEGDVILGLSDGAALDVAALDRAVRKSGFTLSALLVRDARGTLSSGSNGERLLTCSEPRVTFRVQLEAGSSANSGTEILATGSVTNFEELPARLDVTAFGPAPKPGPTQ